MHCEGEWCSSLWLFISNTYPFATWLRYSALTMCCIIAGGGLLKESRPIQDNLCVARSFALDVDAHGRRTIYQHYKFTEDQRTRLMCNNCSTYTNKRVSNTMCSTSFTRVRCYLMWLDKGWRCSIVRFTFITASRRRILDLDISDCTRLADLMMCHLILHL